MFNEPADANADGALERELTELGPHLNAISLARSETPDAEWSAALRLRMVQPADTVINPAFERRLRKRLVGRTSRFPTRTQIATPIAALLVAAAALSLILHPFSSSPSRGTHINTALPPLPTTHDLLRSYPYLAVHGAGGGGGGLTTTSLMGAQPGEAYPTNLHLTGGPFPSMGSNLSVYQLSVHTLSTASIRSAPRRLGIPGQFACAFSSGYLQERCVPSSWRVVVQYPTTHRFRVHSLAVSPLGEVVYQDLPYRPRTVSGAGFSRRAAIQVARKWLSGLGWPVNRMPVLDSGGASGKDQLIVLNFGWPGHIHTTIPSATISVTPTGRVLGADMWPPISRRQEVPIRSVDSAWHDVATGKAPIAVQSVGSLSPFPPGAGHASEASIVDLLVTPKQGPAYLEPAYRFSGTVRLGAGLGTRAWYALVPAIRAG